MNELWFTLLGIGLCVLAFGFLSAAHWALKTVTKLDEAITKLGEAVATTDDFVIAVADLSGAAKTLATLPRYVEGHSKAGIAMAREIEALRKVVGQFSAMLISPKTSGLSYPDERKASDWGDIQSLLRAGVSEDDARTEVENENAMRVALGVE